MDRKADRIRKLLNLAKSGNANEAANALKQAQGLMKKYGLTDYDIATATIETKQCNLNTVKIPSWIAPLITIIEDAFCVKACIGNHYDGNSVAFKSAVIFVGTETNIEIAAYCFEVLSKHLTIARRNFVAKLHHRCSKKTKMERGDWYCIGWTSEVRSKVEAIADPEMEAAINTWLSHNTKKSDVSSIHSRNLNIDSNKAVESFSQGIEDGKNVFLSVGVKGSQVDRVSGY